MTEYAIEISSLHKTYSNGDKALNGIDVNIKKGDFFALLGPNGAGKSTTIGIICSLITKSSGKIKVFDYDLDTDPGLAKLQLGVVPQEFNFNQFENVLDVIVHHAGFYGVPPALAHERAKGYLQHLDLWDRRFQQTRTLSGGMKRRLMIARALIHEPKILILDEPTAGVDVELRRTMWAFLRYINEEKNVTIILTTHYLEEAETLCKGIAIIDKGTIIENTTVKKLLSTVNRHTFVFEFAEPITQIPNLSIGEAKLIDDHSMEIVLPSGTSLNSVFTDLSAFGYEVMSMRNRENRLEALFIEMTNKKGKS